MGSAVANGIQALALTVSATKKDLESTATNRIGLTSRYSLYSLVLFPFFHAIACSLFETRYCLIETYLIRLFCICIICIVCFLTV